jgi:large conductance mechanosensitive channel
VKEFKKFIIRGNMVDLAVAVVVGGAFGSIVTALVKDLITPLIAAIGGKPNFESLHFTLNGSTFLYGDFINALVSFLIIAAVVFFLVVKPVNHVLGRLKPDDDVDAPAEKKCKFCLSAIPAEARICKFCTNKVA